MRQIGRSNSGWGNAHFFFCVVVDSVALKYGLASHSVVSLRRHRQCLQGVECRGLFVKNYSDPMVISVR